MYDYLYGQNFVLITDHEPLVRIFAPKKGIAIMDARRLQRYANFLNAFRYTIKYIKSKGNYADGLSRLPTVINEIKNIKVKYSYFDYINNSNFICVDWKTVENLVKTQSFH